MIAKPEPATLTPEYWNGEALCFLLQDRETPAWRVQQLRRAGVSWRECARRLAGRRWAAYQLHQRRWIYEPLRAVNMLKRLEFCAGLLARLGAWPTVYDRAMDHITALCKPDEIDGIEGILKGAGMWRCDPLDLSRLAVKRIFKLKVGGWDVTATVYLTNPI